MTGQVLQVAVPVGQGIVAAVRQDGGGRGKEGGGRRKEEGGGEEGGRRGRREEGGGEGRGKPLSRGPWNSMKILKPLRTTSALGASGIMLG